MQNVIGVMPYNSFHAIPDLVFFCFIFLIFFFSDIPDFRKSNYVPKWSNFKQKWRKKDSFKRPQEGNYMIIKQTGINNSLDLSVPSGNLLRQICFKSGMTSAKWTPKEVSQTNVSVSDNFVWLLIIHVPMWVIQSRISWTKVQNITFTLISSRFPTPSWKKGTFTSSAPPLPPWQKLTAVHLRCYKYHICSNAKYCLY